MTSRSICWLTAMLFYVAVGSPVLADVAVPENVLNPRTPAEAWNVIRLATSNIERLLSENRMAEIPVQISLCSPALRALPASAATQADKDAITTQASEAIGWILAVARTAGGNNAAATSDSYRGFKVTLDELKRRYDAKVVDGDIFTCRMHPDFISPAASTPCGKCSRSLLKRRIPYSFIYTTPGKPSVVLTASAHGPVEAGRKMEVIVRLARQDKTPVLHDDLMVMHAEPIHLLIEDPSLGDYHHAHPVATDIPGEYAFSFTPRKTSPYRIWADIVPHDTGVQELPYADLPSSGQPGSIQETENSFSSNREGYQFALTLSGGNEVPIKAGETRSMGITISDVNGQPVKTLEPVMEAFAHLVGFYGDYDTVVHLHPLGGDILNPEARGGPALSFQFFPPKAGFMRLYCQVRIGGKMLFAPFNVNVTP